MNLRSNLILLTALGMLFAACSSGKRMLEKGDYDRAVYQAVNRLKGDTNNKKALLTLKDAYYYAAQNHLNRIDDATLSDNILRWEVVLEEYMQLNNLADNIKSTPAGLQAVPDLKIYDREFAATKLKAAEVRYARGNKFLAKADKQSARRAYEDFEQADRLYGRDKINDIQLKLDSAYALALTRVVVEPVQINSRLYKLSNDYFQQKIDEYLYAYEHRSFVKFYSPQEAKREQLVPDQVLSLNFDDFVVGQTYVKENQRDIERDSVIIGETRQKKPIYGTVKARFIVFESTISSAGLLDFSILDWKTRKVLTREKMEGNFIWRDEWATYKGDDRALTDNQIKLTNRRPSEPPPPQAMFLEFTKPIYEQLVYKINNFYRYD